MPPEISEFPSVYQETVGRPVELSVSLKDHSHFRIGGDADYFIRVSSESEIKETVRIARNYKIPFYVIGEGTNILFDDRGFRGLIIKNDILGINEISRGVVQCMSGESLENLLGFCEERELGDMEFLAGIPGTVGGAVFGNAGAFFQDIGRLLTGGELLSREGRLMTVDQKYFSFGYRWSVLKDNHFILLKASFTAQHKDRNKIKEQISENLASRKAKHPPWETACAGSYFKNPDFSKGEKVPAARLLEQAGAKDLSVGDAAVYSGHSNFIINQGKATARDVLALAYILKQRVIEKFGIELTEEVVFLPAEPEKAL